jgi:hypothetical protein
LSNYISEEVKLEAKRQNKFMRGLQGVMKMQMQIVRAKEFQELLDTIKVVEEKENKEQYGKGKEVQVGDQQVSNSQQVPIKPKLRTCHNCEMRGHISRECSQPKVTCYGCGEPGHNKHTCLNKHLDPRLQAGGSQQPTGMLPHSRGFGEGTSTEKSSGKLNGKRKFESINQDDSATGTSKSNHDPHSSYR